MVLWYGIVVWCCSMVLWYGVVVWYVGMVCRYGVSVWCVGTVRMARTVHRSQRNTVSLNLVPKV